MYHVMVVDDEPMAASLIVNIIKRKYSDFEIMGTAYDGEEALELMEEKGEPDVLRYCQSVFCLSSPKRSDCRNSTSLRGCRTITVL